MRLKSVEAEAAACRKAFKGVTVGAVVQHCHHEQWLEILTEPAENRILFILNSKSEGERAARLRLFRPFSSADAKGMPRKTQKADADCRKADADKGTPKLHSEICDCPWSAKLDIFGKAR